MYALRFFNVKTKNRKKIPPLATPTKHHDIFTMYSRIFVHYLEDFNKISSTTPRARGAKNTNLKNNFT